MLTASSDTEALEELHRLGCTDGLPVVIPTAQRVERMVLASGFDPDLDLGPMGPAMAACIIEKVAVAAVMAGCLPDHMPVVVAAVRAVLDERFDCTEMQATTHAIAPLVIVSGPARDWCGLHGGFGALGPGHRANASIGRALRLAMINVGGGRSGTSDMALMGHPGKFTMCLGEDADNSPFDALHVARGFDNDQSVVTVLGTDAPHSVMGVVDADDPTSSDRLLQSLATGFANVATNNVSLRGGQVALALNPDHASSLATAGHSRASICEAIAERAVVPGAVMAASAASMGPVDHDRNYKCFRSPDDIVLFVAGGGGLYSAAFPSWCAGPHRNRAVSVPIEVGQTCDIPGFAS
jgi:hypothetical protein